MILQLFPEVKSHLPTPTPTESELALWLTLTLRKCQKPRHRAQSTHGPPETLCVSTEALGALPSLHWHEPRLAGWRGIDHLEQLRPFQTSQPQPAWQLTADT